MPVFEVTYYNRETERVTASRYLESKGWIVFQRDEDGVPVESLRLKGSRVIRVERVDD